MAVASALRHLMTFAAWASSTPAWAWALCITMLALALCAHVVSVGYGAALEPPAVPSAFIYMNWDAVAVSHADPEHQRCSLHVSLNSNASGHMDHAASTCPQGCIMRHLHILGVHHAVCMFSG